MKAGAKWTLERVRDKQDAVDMTDFKRGLQEWLRWQRVWLALFWQAYNGGRYAELGHRRGLTP